MSKETLNKELRDILVQGYFRSPEQCIEYIKQAFVDNGWVDFSSLPKDLPEQNRPSFLLDMVNREVIKVLTILETANNHYADGEEALFNNEGHVPLSAIKDMKHKYEVVFKGRSDD